MEFRCECFEMTVRLLGAKPHTSESQIVARGQLPAVLLAGRALDKELSDFCSSLTSEK